VGIATVFAAVVGLAATSAWAAPGQCSVGEEGTFACDVTMDGAGLTFALPDGQVFAFALVEEGEGLAYLLDPDDQRPRELGAYVPDGTEPGCWINTRRAENRFCVSVAQ
jgi:hypothetical protein